MLLCSCSLRVTGIQVFSIFSCEGSIFVARNHCARDRKAVEQWPSSEAA